jgi:hypothetical protein
MFATILRRWRLVTPLLLAVLSISIVAGDALSTTAASAHNVAFHFFGRAYALNDLQPIPDTACDTGFLPEIGQVKLDTGACFGAAGPGQPGVAVTGGVLPGFNPSRLGNAGVPTDSYGRMFAIYADDTVASTHGTLSGRVVAAANVLGGVNVCISQFACDILYTTPGFAVLEHGCYPAAKLKAVDVTTEGRNGQDVHSDVIAVKTFVPTVFCAQDVEETAFAYCHRRGDGSTQASVGAALPYLNTPGFTENGQFFVLGDSNGQNNGSFGLINETFPISYFVKSGLDVIVTLNEQHPFVDGDLGGIAATAVHIVATTPTDIVVADFYIAHVFAGIHCASHLGTEQNTTGLFGGYQ